MVTTLVLRIPCNATTKHKTTTGIAAEAVAATAANEKVAAASYLNVSGRHSNEKQSYG